MACMAQEYHGDGDVDGPLHKIGNTNVNVMVMWGSLFILAVLKTFGMFNIK